MKKMLVLGGVGIAFLVACDRSIESRLQRNLSDNAQQSETISNIEEKTMQVVEKNEEPVKHHEDILSEKNKDIKENEPLKEVLHKEIKSETTSVSQPILEKETQKNQITSEENIKSVEKIAEIKKENTKKIVQPENKTLIKSAEKSGIKLNTKVGTLEKKPELARNNQKITQQSKKETIIKKETSTRNTKLREERQPDKKSVDKRIETTENKENHLVEKKSKNNNGTYENGQLVSNFTEEELRLGAQKPLTKDEIQYYKSLCRYAYMSEQDVVENRCEAKKVSFSKKVYSN